jgi:hypothetical protein
MLQLLMVLIAAMFQQPHTGHAAQVMGFDQDRTAHHFFLYADGGAIDVSVKESSDTADRDAIRAHLPHITMMFGEGNFDAPMLVHDTKDVPGIDVLAARREHITYRYAETPRGGRVDITTTDRDALAALHDFLRYQIREHKTGDSGTVVPRR